MSYCIKIPNCMYMGSGSITSLRKILEYESAKSVLILTDEGILKAGLIKKITDILDCADIRWVLDASVKPEPSYQEVMRIIEKMRKSSCQMVVALGGGSVMDTAKLYSVLKDAEYTIQDLLEQKVKVEKFVKTVMVPTTCGTGAEATGNAIVAIPEESVKKGIVSWNMIADYVILDPEMIRDLPPAIIASTGIDALAHAVECYTSNKASMLSNLYAKEAAKLLFHNIRVVYDQRGTDKERSNMLLGAYYAGIAITGSGTTAVHALSYPLGGKYHIAHGTSNAILFGPVMRMNKDVILNELADLAEYIWPELMSLSIEKKAEALIKEIENIVSYTNIPVNLQKFGVKIEDLSFLIKAGSQQTRLLNNNKKKLTQKEIENIYRQVIKEEETNK